MPKPVWASFKDNLQYVFRPEKLIKRDISIKFWGTERLNTSNKDKNAFHVALLPESWRSYSGQVVVKGRGHGFKRKRAVVLGREMVKAVQHNERIEVKRERGSDIKLDSEEEEDWARPARMLGYIALD